MKEEITERLHTPLPTRIPLAEAGTAPEYSGAFLLNKDADTGCKHCIMRKTAVRRQVNKAKIERPLFKNRFKTNQKAGKDDTQGNRIMKTILTSKSRLNNLTK